jgi:hypothetical protein
MRTEVDTYSEVQRENLETLNKRRVFAVSRDKMNYPEGTAPKEISSDTLPAMSHRRKSDRLRSASPTSEYQKIAIDTESMNEVTSRKD